MDICSSFIANPQSPKLVEPGKTAFYDPSPSAEATAVFCVAHREQRYDAAVAQTLPYCFRVITAVAQHAIGPKAWTTALSLQRWDGVDECQSFL